MFAHCPSRLLLLPILLVSFAVLVLAQDAQPTPQASPTPLTAPPPLRTITKEEHSQITEASDPKTRVRTTLELAQVHLANAEKFTSESNFEAASHQIGSYHALIQDIFTFLATMKRDANKTRDLYKRLELQLRADGPRLTAMRRTTPLEFAVWIKQVEDFAREGRTEALNSFYGHTVIHDQLKPDEKSTEKPPETPMPKSKQP